jgi:hypothetical protein
MSSDVLYPSIQPRVFLWEALVEFGSALQDFLILRGILAYQPRHFLEDRLKDFVNEFGGSWFVPESKLFAESRPV